MQMQLRVLKVPRLHQGFQILVLLRYEHGTKATRVVSERIGKQDELTSQSLYCHSAKVGTQVLDQNLGPGAISALGGLNNEFYVVDEESRRQTAPNL